MRRELEHEIDMTDDEKRAARKASYRGMWTLEMAWYRRFRMDGNHEAAERARDLARSFAEEYAILKGQGYVDANI